MRLINPASRSGGFTLVEVLVTVVIFSVGLLGLAGLQATGIKLNHSSLLRSQATLLAYDIIDCMRANQGKNKANLPDYAIAMDDNPPTTATNQADRDIINWIDSLAKNLPSGDGSVTFPTTNRAEVIVQWDDARTGDPTRFKSMTVVTDI